MNDFHSLMLSRRSIRKYTSEEIAPEDVQLIVEAGLMAPSSKGKCPWQFILTDDRDMLTSLSQCKDFGAKPLEGCKLAIIITASPEKSDVWIEDASIAAFAMQLQAEDLNIGSCWIQIRNRFRSDGVAAEEYVRDLLEIPEEQQILCCITLGHKGETRKPYDTDNIRWEKVHLKKW